MCKITVNLPTVASFLIFYSLRCGCLFICIWTLIRSMGIFSFFITTATLTFMPTARAEERPSDKNYSFAFLGNVALIVTECFVFMFAIGLGKGIYVECPSLLKEYLISRFCAWIVETISLVVLCICQQYYIGWYLVFLMILILELYAFIVVYSYYVDVVEELGAKEYEGLELNSDSMLDDDSLRQMHEMHICRNEREILDIRDVPHLLNTRL